MIESQGGDVYVRRVSMTWVLTSNHFTHRHASGYEHTMIEYDGPLWGNSLKSPLTNQDIDPTRSHMRHPRQAFTFLLITSSQQHSSAAR